MCRIAQPYMNPIQNAAENETSRSIAFKTSQKIFTKNGKIHPGLLVRHKIPLTSTLALIGYIFAFNYNF